MGFLPLVRGNGPWDIHGMPGGCPWAGRDSCHPVDRESVLTTHGLLTGCTWFAHGIPSHGLAAIAHGMPIGGPLVDGDSPWVALWMLMCFIWVAHELPLCCPPVAHGLRMVADCPRQRVPWDFGKSTDVHHTLLLDRGGRQFTMFVR